MRLIKSHSTSSLLPQFQARTSNNHFTLEDSSVESQENFIAANNATRISQVSSASNPQLYSNVSRPVSLASVPQHYGSEPMLLAPPVPASSPMIVVQTSSQEHLHKKQKLGHKVVNLVLKWLETYDPNFQASERDGYYKTWAYSMLHFIEKLLASFQRQLTLESIIYADRFVRKLGINQNSLFSLLLTSSLVSTKMWDDKGIKNTTIATTLGYDVAQVNADERNFLEALDYSLYLTKEDISDFKKLNF